MAGLRLTGQAKLVTGLTLFLCLALPVYAQIYSSSITGVVTDPNGALIPNARVSIRNTDTNSTRSIESGHDGNYTVPRLAPGPYEVSAEANGFKRAVLTDIQLTSSQVAEVNFQLEVGALSESVMVHATAMQIDTQTANQSVTYRRQDVVNLPQNLRSPISLVYNTAGVVQSSSGGQESTQDQNHARFSLSGGRDLSTLIMVDGVIATAADWGGVFAFPGVDATEEVQVLRNAYDAEYGRTGGGVVSIVSRGGSNSFHGSAFDFLRNDNLDANTWERNKAFAGRPEYKRNQFGGTFGGPVWRRKRVFFFAGYEGLRIPSAGSLIDSVPSPIERQGDFSQSFNRNGTRQIVFDPFTTRPNPSGSGQIRDAFSDNRIPANRFDPVGLKVLSLFPLPNRPGDPITHAQNFFASAPFNTESDRIDGRIDWSRNEMHTLYGRFTHLARQSATSPRFFGNGADTGSDDVFPRDMVTIASTLVPSPNWVFSIIAGFGRWVRVSTPPSLIEGPGLESLGLPGSLLAQVQSKSLGSFSFTDYLTLGNRRAFANAKDTRSLAVNVTRELGVHSFKFGFLGESAKHNFLDEFSPAFRFDRGMTSGPVAALTSSVAGNSIASLLLGTGASGDNQINSAPAVSQNYYAWFFQDSWRVSKRLTLNLGMRYEMQRPRTERFNQQNWFDFKVPNPLAQRVGLPLHGGLVFTDEDHRGVNEPDFTDLAPRGFAYKVLNTMVVRGGYGIMYDRTYNLSSVLGIDGYAATSLWVASLGNSGIQPLNLLGNPYPSGVLQSTGRAAGLLTDLGAPVNAWRYENPSPYVQTFSLDIQYQASAKSIFEIGYSGNLGRKLMYGGSRNANQLNPAFLKLGAELDRAVPNPFFGVITTGVLSTSTIPQNRLLREYPQFASVDLILNEKGASSSYHSLFTRFQLRAGRGLTLSASYQFSKAIDNASENGGPGGVQLFRNYFDPAVDRSISGHDTPHSFVSTLVYQLPVGRGRALGANMPKLADLVVGGWQISTVATAASGLPVSMTAQSTL